MAFLSHGKKSSLQVPGIFQDRVFVILRNLSSTTPTLIVALTGPLFQLNHSGLHTFLCGVKVVDDLQYVVWAVSRRSLRPFRTAKHLWSFMAVEPLANMASSWMTTWIFCSIVTKFGSSSVSPMPINMSEDLAWESTVCKGPSSFFFRPSVLHDLAASRQVKLNTRFFRVLRHSCTFPHRCGCENVAHPLRQEKLDWVWRT